MSKPIQVSDETFETEVLQGKQPVLVDFWAGWCGPCRTLGPTIEELAVELEGRARVGKLDVDSHPDVAERYGVQSIPSVLLFVDGKVTDRLVGVQAKQAYLDALEPLS